MLKLVAGIVATRRRGRLRLVRAVPGWEAAKTPKAAIHRRHETERPGGQDGRVQFGGRGRSGDRPGNYPWRLAGHAQRQPGGICIVTAVSYV